MQSTDNEKDISPLPRPVRPYFPTRASSEFASTLNFTGFSTPSDDSVDKLSAQPPVTPHGRFYNLVTPKYLQWNPQNPHKFTLGLCLLYAAVSQS